MALQRYQCIQWIQILQKESDVLEAIRLLTVGQERLKNQISECLTGLSRVTEGKYQGISQISKFNGENKFCPVHDTESHGKQDCTTFHTGQVKKNRWNFQGKRELVLPV